MFDIGPAELLVIFVVALLVIGPERLPATVRTVSLWIGRFRRSFHRIKADVERELNADEIRRQLHNESILAEVEEAKKQAKDFKNQVEKSTAPEDKKTVPELSSDDSAEAEVGAKDSTTPPVVGPAPKPDSAGSSAGKEVSQALSYVNDITREVKSSTEEIARELKQPDKKTAASKADKKP